MSDNIKFVLCFSVFSFKKIRTSGKRVSLCLQAAPAPSASTSLSSPGSAGTATPPDCYPGTRSDMASSLAKRLCGTPERIELENYKPSLQKENSPLQEVPEETLAQHNLSASLQDKNSEEQSR